MFILGCKWTVEYFLTGCAGGFVALVILPGCYIVMPSVRKHEDEVRVYLGALARVIVAGIAGCVVDCSSRNAFFAGFFAWHVFKWLESQGWRELRARLLAMVKSGGDKQ